MVPWWSLLLIFVFMAGLFYLVYTNAGDRFPGTAPALVIVSVALTAVIGAIPYAQRGYVAIGTGGTWAWILAVAHMTVMVTVFASATSVIRRYARTKIHPFLPEDDLRLLGRLRMTRNVGRILVLLSVLLVEGIGLANSPLPM